MQSPLRALGRVSTLLLALCATAVLLPTLAQVAARVAFPYDYIAWPDDYVLNEILKLRAGRGVYGSYADTDSFIYSPGVPWLHHLLLGPLGLDGSIVANRVLSQVYLGAALLLALVTAFTIRPMAAASTRFERAVVVTFAAAWLALAAYWNVVADSLHPGNLELLVLCAASLVAARWPALSLRSRLLAAVLLPACGVVAKQAAGSVAFALVGVAMLSPAPRRERLQVSLAAVGSLVAMVVLLVSVTHGGFWAWGVRVPLLQSIDWFKLAWLPVWLGGVVALIALVTIGAVRAHLRRGEAEADAFRRVALVPLAYLPFGMVSLLKALGGPNNFGSPVVLGAMLALPVLGELVAAASRVGGFVGATSLAAIQIVAWAPKRRVPDARDAATASLLCAYVTERMRCGENVLLDQGSACLGSAGAEAMPDRAFSRCELHLAGLDAESRTVERIEREQYDLVVVHAHMPGYYDERVSAALWGHYRIFYIVPPGQLGGSLWADGWQNLQPPALVLERKSDEGWHQATLGGRCLPRPRAR